METRLLCKRCGRPIYPGERKKRKRRYGGFVCQRCLNALWKAKGYAAERDLVRRFRELGYWAVRMAVSGAGSEPIPDVVVRHDNPPQEFVFEVKAVSKKRWTVQAWKKDRKGKPKKGQLVKLIEWIRGVPDVIKDRRAGVAIKFLLGERVKALWVIRFINDPGDLTKLKDITVDITDKSDMPEISNPSRSKRTRKIIRRRKEIMGKS